MEYHFEATEDFLVRQNEIHILLNTAREKSEEKDTFLKLAVVSLVTKFQVFVESLLKEFLYIIKNNNVEYSKLSVYMRLNTIKIGLDDNPLIKLTKHDKLTNETQEKIKRYIEKIAFITNENTKVDDALVMRTSFPLGRTGKDELLNLFKQVDGKTNIFIDSDTQEEVIDLNQLDSLLLTRHLIIHQDRFNQTDSKIIDYIEYLNRVVLYCDEYLACRLGEYGVQLEQKYIEYEGWERSN